ncbi:MAG TPA: hypothetical protein VHF88_07515 [Thermoleophilaceae bacterium]|nr:hypothetical protein [Thermoleophilaceae bacterium]
MSQPALSLNFFDPEHGLHGNARSGMTLLFEGSSSRALADGAQIEAAGGGWRAELNGAFELDLESVAPAADLDGVTVHLCVATGKVGGNDVRCMATVSETHAAPSWEELDALRSISALFDEGHAFLAIGRRPRGALGHDAERTVAWLLDDGQALPVEDARISTVYDGDGRQRSAGLELWLADEDHALRGSGTVVAGSSLQLEAADVHAAIFRWRLGDREGAGSYELMTRSEPEAA